MRVSIDARYVREKPSGIGVYVTALVDRLGAAAPDDRFELWAHPLARRPLSPAANVSEFVVPPGPNSPLPLYWPSRYASFTGVDVFHSPHNLLPRGIPCPTVVMVHDVMSIEEPDLHLQGIERIVKTGYYQRAVWRAIRDATRLIVPTRAVADRVTALCPAAAHRTHVIWEAADPEFRPPDHPARAHEIARQLTGFDAPYLLVVGAHVPTKRHDLALAAFARATQAPWHLVFVHRQGSFGRLERLAHELGVESRVLWFGRSARSDLVTLFQGASGLIQPSVYEGFGLPVIEALACGCPVVASDIPPFSEVAAGTALLAASGDAAALESAIRRLTSSPDLRQSLSAKGIERARAFSWDRAVRETVDVYREAAAAGAAHGRQASARA